MPKKVASRGSDQFNLRFPDGLRDKIKEVADANGRSMNSEIIERLAFSTYAHPHAYLLRALLELQEKLLYGKEEVEVPPHLQDELRRVAHERGLAPQKLLVRLVLEAMDALDEQTELGKELDQRLRQYAIDDARMVEEIKKRAAASPSPSKRKGRIHLPKDEET